MTARRDYTVPLLLAAAILLSVAAFWLPGWLRYVGQTAFSTALAALGVMILLRAGLLSFGQGLFYFAGAYTVALAYKYAGLTDGPLLILASCVVAGLASAVIGLLIARYRGIFFAMLTLALSMVAYGIAIKVSLFGGSDGLNIGLISIFGFRLRGPSYQIAIFVLCVWTACVLCVAAHLFLRSRLGKVIEAVEDNEVRLEFLGQSVRASVHVAYVVAGVLGGAGGALAGISARHVDPGFAFWTTSGDLVFIVLLSGQASVFSPLGGALVLEVLRIFASAFFPDAWQLVTGSIMLLIVMFLPNGLGHLLVVAWRLMGRRSKPRQALIEAEGDGRAPRA